MATIILKGDSQENNATLVFLRADYTCKFTNFMRSTNEKELKMSGGGTLPYTYDPPITSNHVTKLHNFQ